MKEEIMATKQKNLDGELIVEINKLKTKKKHKSRGTCRFHPDKMSGNIKRKRFFEGRK